MLRTQIYLSEDEKKGLRKLAAKTGKKQSELIREAVDRFIESFGDESRLSDLRSAKGIWRDRKDLPDFHKLREEMDKR